VAMHQIYSLKVPCEITPHSNNGEKTWSQGTFVHHAGVRAEQVAVPLTQQTRSAGAQTSVHADEQWFIPFLGPDKESGAACERPTQLQG